MKVLIIGSGGREHALAWKIAQSPLVSDILCMPGNAGIAQYAKIVPEGPNGVLDMSDVEQIAEFAQKEDVDLTVVGPEAYLAMGIVDVFQQRGMKIVGPTKAAAEIESSKVFSKQLMMRAKVPTAAFHIADNAKEAKTAIRSMELPVVVKAEGLAAGKGVIIAHTLEEADQAVDLMMGSRIFGDAGDRLVIEEFLVGQEATVLAFVDGERFVTMPASQDHKAIGEGDTGANTGGMGAYAPAPVMSRDLMEQVESTIIGPVVRQMREEGRPFHGILYAGLMLTETGPYTVEFNGRFGDPEAQVILPLLQNDLVPALLATIDGNVHDVQLQWADQSAVCVIVASGGYPGSYETGFPITIDIDEKAVTLFHSGTKQVDQTLVTAGGRVLGVTAVAPTLREARDKAYSGVDGITFDHMNFRKDIGWRAL